MKTKVNLTIDEQLLAQAKRYAAKKSTSVPELLRKYLQRVTRSPKQKSIIEVMENINTPSIPSDKDLKKEFYDNMEKKYGL